ncbi:hypothetical protein OOZ15_19570 [Galbibacter sp. EGI 63066]|nr:hypothetical protein [Galbibacter sp. EGI 63066]
MEYIGNINTCNFAIQKLSCLIARVRPPFVDPYKNLLNVIKKDSFALKVKNKYVYIKLVLPMRFEKDFVLTLQTIVLHYEGMRLTDLILINQPICTYRKEPFEVELYVNNRQDVELASFLKSQLEPVVRFSKKQERVIDLTLRGLDSHEIALMTDKSVPSVYKINRRILEKITDYYEMEFPDVRSAVLFLRKNFI